MSSADEKQTVKNPKTKRLITLGGAVYRKLIKEGYEELNGELVKEPVEQEPVEQEIYQEIYQEEPVEQEQEQEPVEQEQEQEQEIYQKEPKKKTKKTKVKKVRILKIPKLVRTKTEKPKVKKYSRMTQKKLTDYHSEIARGLMKDIDDGNYVIDNTKSEKEVEQVLEKEIHKRLVSAGKNKTQHLDYKTQDDTQDSASDTE